MLKIGIIGAMDEEVLHLAQIMALEKKETVAKQTYYLGSIASVPVVLVRSGIGKVNAALCAQILITKYGASHIINTGIAGGLDKKLKMLDFVVSTDAVQHDFDVTAFGYPATVIPRMESSVFTADKKLITAAIDGFAVFLKKEKSKSHVHKGRIATGDSFVASLEAKQKIVENCKALCVEMEGGAIAQTAMLNQTPFVIIRCISDMAEDKTEQFYEEVAAKMSGMLVEEMLSLLSEHDGGKNAKT